MTPGTRATWSIHMFRQTARVDNLHDVPVDRANAVTHLSHGKGQTTFEYVAKESGSACIDVYETQANTIVDFYDGFDVVGLFDYDLQPMDVPIGPPFAEFADWVAREIWGRSVDDVLQDMSRDSERLTGALDENLGDIRLDALADDLDSLKLGQQAIYRQVTTESRDALHNIAVAVRGGRLAHGEIDRTLDAMRRSLVHIQREGLFDGNREIQDHLKHIDDALDSGLKSTQKLEISLPVIPFLVNIKADVGLRSDLRKIWKRLVRASKQRD